MALQHIASVQFGDITPGRVVNTKEIAEEYNIPLELLAKVLQTLAKNGMIESHNGPKGGYLLGRSARQITIAQILESMQVEAKVVRSRLQRRPMQTVTAVFETQTVRAG